MRVNCNHELGSTGTLSRHFERITVAKFNQCLLPALGGNQLHDMMKGALTGIASVVILVVTVGVETANAQSYRRMSSLAPILPIALSSMRPRMGYACCRRCASSAREGRFGTRTIRMTAP